MTSIVRAKLQRPVMEVLEQNGHAVLYREKFHNGVRLVYRQYLTGCDDFSDIIYIGEDGYLFVFHVHGRLNREDYLHLFLDDKTASQIRSELLSIKTFRDFKMLFDKLLNTTFCYSGRGTYHICE